MTRTLDVPCSCCGSPARAMCRGPGGELRPVAHRSRRARARDERREERRAQDVLGMGMRGVALALEEMERQMEAWGERYAGGRHVQAEAAGE